jgi:hypothetical protein
MPTRYQSSILLSQCSRIGNDALESRNAGPGVAFPGPVRLAEMLKTLHFIEPGGLLVFRWSPRFFHLEGISQLRSPPTRELRRDWGSG